MACLASCRCCVSIAVHCSACVLFRGNCFRGEDSLSAGIGIFQRHDSHNKVYGDSYSIYIYILTCQRALWVSIHDVSALEAFAFETTTLYTPFKTLSRFNHDVNVLRLKVNADIGLEYFDAFICARCLASCRCRASISVHCSSSTYCSAGNALA